MDVVPINCRIDLPYCNRSNLFSHNGGQWGQPQLYRRVWTVLWWQSETYDYSSEYFEVPGISTYSSRNDGYFVCLRLFLVNAHSSIFQFQPTSWIEYENGLKHVSWRLLQYFQKWNYISIKWIEFECIKECTRS